MPAERRSNSRTARPPFKERARAFAFQGQGEHERFGIFDPAVRMTFAVGILTAVIIAGLSVGESQAGGSRGAALALAVLAAAAVGVGGSFAYRRIWMRPPEREVLLQLAREEDESKRLVAARERQREAERRGEGTKGIDAPR